MTALHYAAINGHPRVVRTLLNAKADPATKPVDPSAKSVSAAFRWRARKIWGVVHWGNQTQGCTVELFNYAKKWFGKMVKVGWL